MHADDDAAEANGVVLAVGHCTRFHAVHRKAKELLDSGAIGRPVSAKVHASFWYPPEENICRKDYFMAGGGPVYDMASHAIDFLRYMLGEVSDVAAFVDHVIFDYEAEDTSTLVLQPHLSR
ncbi:MAG: Gfo/Idh/MocA family oxidoreductase [Armatimonadetes bacterium]|nr:Gfo/Idh/MocA family oxidoreductase [Armatimonadota bacterium]